MYSQTWKDAKRSSVNISLGHVLSVSQFDVWAWLLCCNHIKLKKAKFNSFTTHRSLLLSFRVAVPAVLKSTINTQMHGGTGQIFAAELCSPAGFTWQLLQYVCTGLEKCNCSFPCKMPAVILSYLLLFQHLNMHICFHRRRSKPV